MSASIKALAYRPFDRTPEENKQGFVYYAGTPQDYHFWKFKTELRSATTKDEKFANMMARLIESLRGDALQIAVDIGAESLTTSGRSGLKTLHERITSHVFPIMKDEVPYTKKVSEKEGCCHGRKVNRENISLLVENGGFKD